MSGEETDGRGPQATVTKRGDASPFEQSSDPATRGDVAATARWLEERRASAQTEMTGQMDRQSGALRVTNDHLVLIRSENARLRSEMSEGFDMVGKQAQMLQRDIYDRRGRIRWLLAVVLGFLLGLAVPVDKLLSLIQGTGG